MASKIRIVSADYRFDNSVDSMREYNVSASANAKDNALQDVNSGEVRSNKNEDVMSNPVECYFNATGNTSVNYNFQGNLALQERISIMTAIDEFIAEMAAYLSASPVSESF